LKLGAISMNKIKFASLLTGLGLLFAQTPSFAGVTLNPATGGSQYVEGEILVKFKPGVAAAMHTQIARNYGAQAVQTLAHLPAMALAKLMPGQSVEQAVSAYANDPNVEYAQPNYIYHALATPTPTLDPGYGKLWAAKNTGQTISPYSYTINNPPVTAGNDMNLESAWDVQTDCSSVVVAVVDTGINYNSTDLANNMWAGNAKYGQNFASDRPTGAGSDPMDLNGHGTHVAGIIGAEGGNGIGGAGVCWKASLMAVRVLEASGSGTTAAITQGVTYAVTNGAKVINMSLGGGGADTAFSDAITNAQANDVLVVVAAGNEANNNDGVTASYPCNYTQANVICVAALDQNYALANFSNWGITSVDVGAPGTNIYSTWAGTSSTITDPLDVTAAWTMTGGWGYVNVATYKGLADPATWPAGTYAASANDHVYKNFDLSQYDVAILNFWLTGVVNSGDSLTLAVAPNGGDPFTAGGAVAAGSTSLVSKSFNYYNSITNSYYFIASSYDISQCLTATCTLGAMLKSAATSAGAEGPRVTNLTIDTLALNASSYNTIDGTSIDTPEVAGVAALVWAHNPLYTYADVAAAIKNGGRSVSALSTKTTTGKAVDGMGSLSYINPPTGIAVAVQ
jgi:thermitase